MRRALDVKPPDGYGSGWWQVVARRSQQGGRARLCAYVKHSTLNYAIEQELRDRRVEDRTGPARQALLSGGSVLVNPSIEKVRTKLIKKCM